MAHSGLAGLYPPLRFAMVEKGLYRGAYPTLKNMRFLKRLSLKTLISVTPEPVTSDLSEFCEDESITAMHLRTPRGTDDGVQFSADSAVKIVQVLVQPERHPVYIHGLNGAENTGLIVCCLRRLQAWSLPAIYAEAERYLDRSVSSHERKFVEEIFRVSISLPAVIPDWLWGGVPRKHHPILVLSYPNGVAKPYSDEAVEDKRDSEGGSGGGGEGARSRNGSQGDGNGVVESGMKVKRLGRAEAKTASAGDDGGDGEEVIPSVSIIDALALDTVAAVNSGPVEHSIVN